MKEDNSLILKHKRIAYFLTAIETALFVGAIRGLMERPLMIFLNPFWYLHDLFSVKSLMLIVSCQIYLGVKIISKQGKLSKTKVFILYLISQAVFSYYSPNIVGIRQTFRVDEARCSRFLHGLIFSLSSTLLFSCINEISWTGPVYTKTRGLFVHLKMNIFTLLQNTLYFYIGGTITEILLFGLYILIFKAVIFRLISILSFQMLRCPSLSVFSHLLQENSTIVYCFFASLIDELFVYNSSLENIDFCEYFYDEREDVETSRFRFFQMFKLSVKYPQVFRKIARSHCSVVSIGKHICSESDEIVDILKRMKMERDILETKVWLHIPQVAPHSDKPKVLTIRRTAFIRRIKSYNFIEIYTARAIYFWRMRILLCKYMNTRYFFMMIKDFIEFIKKYEEDHLLLKDLSGMFQNQAKRLREDVSSAEEAVEMVLDSNLFC